MIEPTSRSSHPPHTFESSIQQLLSSNRLKGGKGHPQEIGGQTSADDHLHDFHAGI